MKKISAFFFLLAGTMPVIFTLFFLTKQQMIRHEMKEKLEKESLCTISIPERDVVWFKYKKEIFINGRMFDIKSFSTVNGIVVFKGLYDDDETALSKSLETDIHKKNTQSNRILTDLFQLLHSFYLENTNSGSVRLNVMASYNYLTFLHIPSPFINILTPPPQI